MSSPVDVPVLTGNTTERMSVRSRELSGLGGPVATLARTPRVTVRDALDTARTTGFDALQELPIRELLQRIADAARRFEAIGPETTEIESLNDYVQLVTRATGLPIGWVRTSAHWLAYGLRHASESLRAQSPTSGLDIYDTGAYTRERNVGLAFTPRVRVLGAVMPSNDPAVYAWLGLAVAMKIPIVIRPADRDPFTALRLARCLREAGVPESAVHVLPAAREIGDVLCREADHTLLFGDGSTIEPYQDDRQVETYGPGNSAAIIARTPTKRELDTLARGITRSGGRACFNLSRIIATNDCDPDELAKELASRVVEAVGGSPFDSATDVPTFVDPDRANTIENRATAVNGTDVTASYCSTDRLAEVSNGVQLRPTILRTQSLVSELPFPYAGVTQLSREKVCSALSDAYLAVCIGDNALERELVYSPDISKVYSSRYPATVDLRETHERFLVDVLYDRSTYDPGYSDMPPST